jgi:transcriptional regulator with XRE-family HTH domain
MSRESATVNVRDDKINATKRKEMTVRRSPTLITLGRLVRAYREAAGLTQKELAGTLGYTNGWLSNLETAQLRPRIDQIESIEHALSLPKGVLLIVAEQLDAEVLPGWFRPWLDEERQATLLRTFELALIPGLLQTPEYAAVLLDGDENAVRARMERQKILAKEDPPMVHVVVDEAVLYRERGGKEVMRAQLEHLIAAVGPCLTLQVVPSNVNPRSTGAFTIATVDGADVGYIETIVRGIVTSSREDVSVMIAAWEAIRTFALPQQESLDLIKKVIEEKWT